MWPLASRARKRRLFPPAGKGKASTVEKGHGRRERRTLQTTTLLTVFQDWPGLAQGFQLTRERTVRGVTTVERVYGITSLRPEAADAARLLALVREHWKIENELHHVRDVTLGEDACRVRSGAAPQVLAAFRNVAVHLLREVPASSRAAAMRRLNVHPKEALDLLQSPKSQ